MCLETYVMNKQFRFYIIIGFLIIIAGLLMGSEQFFQYLYNHSSQSVFASPSVPKYQVNSKGPLIIGEPSHIKIPSVNISVDVKRGYYDKKSQTWTLSDVKAEYATVTVKPNNKTGNTFIYGHNRPAVFSRLLQAKPGDKAIVTTSNNHRFIYKLAEEKVTKPNDLSLFNYQGSPILTLQTCSGAWYQDRTLLTFNLAEVS